MMRNSIHQVPYHPTNGDQQNERNSSISSTPESLIKLRPSHLFLTRYDECMPSKAFGAGSRSAALLSNSSKTSQRQRSLILSQLPSQAATNRTSSLLNNTSQGSILENGSIGIMKSLSRRLSSIYQGSSNDNFVSELDSSEMLKRKQSVLGEMVSRQRHLLLIVAAVCGILLICGCVLTTICFSRETGDLILGKLLGALLLLVGAFGCLFCGYYLSKPDIEIRAKIKHREKMFSSFQDLEVENLQREMSIFLTEKLVPKSSSNPNVAIGKNNKQK